MKINWFKIDKKDIIRSSSHLIVNNLIMDFSLFFNHLKIGHWCEDCQQNYECCDCNECEICLFPSCICDFELKGLDHEYDTVDELELRKSILEILNLKLRKILSKKIFKNLKIDIKKRLISIKGRLPKNEFKVIEDFLNEN